MEAYNPVYAILYAYFSEDEDVDDPEIYKIILSDYEFSVLPELGCYEYPVFVLRGDEKMKNLFDAAMKAAATGADSFQIEKDGRTLKYTILETKQVDQALAAQYQTPQDIDWTDDELHTVIFYFKSNKCFRQKRHCTAYRARIKPKPEYEAFTDPTTVDVIHCDKCDKYFVTKEIFAAKGGSYQYYLSTEFDPSMSKRGRELALWASYYEDQNEIFDDFAQQTSINKDGYTTTKSATQRQRILRNFIDTGKHTETEIIQYFYEQYLDTGWHGDDATKKVRDDLKYVLDYCTQKKTIDAKLERPQSRRVCVSYWCGKRGTRQTIQVQEL